MPTEFKYDLFISYTREDAAWALKLYNDLINKKGLDRSRIFYSEERIAPGAVWRKELDEAIMKSRQLVLLWSAHAQKSEWVLEERTKFMGQVDSQNELLDGRRLIFIPLQGDNPVYSGKYQGIEDLVKANAYQGGAGNVDQDVWQRVVNKVARMAGPDANLQPIRLVVLAMTQSDINGLDLQTKLPGGNVRLAEAVRRMGLTMQISLLDQLDPTLTLPSDNTLGAALAALNVQTQPDPKGSGEIRVVLGNDKTLGSVLEASGQRTMDELLTWLEANAAGVTLPNGQTLDAALWTEGMRIRPHLENLLIKVALRQYYGVTPLDWRPFGNPKSTISEVMWNVVDNFNRWLRSPNAVGKQFTLEPAGDFWSNGYDAGQERVKLSNGDAVIIIDPLSLYDDEVSRRFGNLVGAFSNKRALIMAFAPFALPTPTGVMRTLINDKAVRIFRSFYQPRVEVEKVLAKCGPDVGDGMDIERWLQTALWPQAEAADNTTKTGVTQEADAIFGRTPAGAA